MRKKRNPQCRLDLACIAIAHEICEELSSISHWLNARPECIDRVFDDLDTGAIHHTPYTIHHTRYREKRTFR